MSELLKKQSRDARTLTWERLRSWGIVPLEALSEGLVMWFGRASATGIAAVTLTLLPVFAAASPPDATWIHGIYDGADGDDVVVLVGDMVGAKHETSPVLFLLLCLSVELIHPRLAIYEAHYELDRERGPPAVSTGRSDVSGPSSPLHHPPFLLPLLFSAMSNDSFVLLGEECAQTARRHGIGPG
jgi:hypothetical protein